MESPRLRSKLSPRLWLHGVRPFRAAIAARFSRGVSNNGDAMATRRDIEQTYGYLDDLWRLTFGDAADITCPLYDGDFSKTLEQAQAAKHQYILNSINFRPGFRTLDVGCGWGGFLLTLRDRGGVGVGLTLASGQHRFCRRHGLDTRLEDWKHIVPASIGGFDAVVSVGAFEHFCSEEDWGDGLQLNVYKNFFKFCRALLRPTQRLYLQTMVWGTNRPAMRSIRVDAPRNSDAYILACLRLFYPGSWLPASLSQIEEAASGLFALRDHKNGREDYAFTMRQWSTRLRQMSVAKIFSLAKLLPQALNDRAFFKKLETLYRDYNGEVFRRHLFDHERIVFEALPI